MLFHVPPLVNLAALHFGPFAEHPLDPRAQRLGSINHEQVTPLRVQSTSLQVFQQCLDHRGVFRRSLPQAQHVLVPAAVDAQRHHQHLLAEMNPVDQDRYQLKFI